MAQRMFKSLLIYISCALILGGCTAKEEPRPVDSNLLVVGVDPDYPPFEFYDEDRSDPVGFDIDLTGEICRINGWRVEFRELPFDNLLAALTGGEIEAAISALTITPQRRAVVAFSDPYYLTGQSILVPSGNKAIGDLADLRGQRVGVQRGAVGESLAKRSDGALVFRYHHIDEAFRRLAEGELDAVINDYPSTRAFVETHEGFEIIDSQLDAEYYGIAVRKESLTRLAGINKALAVLIGDGTYDSLHVKWFGYSWQEEPPADTSSGL